MGQARREAFERQARAHLDALYRTALRMVRNPAIAEDLVQEACLRAYRAFDPDRAPANFRAWMFRILVNLSIDNLRRSRTHAGMIDEDRDMDAVAALGPDAEHIVLEHRLRLDLAAAVEALPPELRIVVQLILVEGMAYEETAACLAVPVGTVRSRLSRARAILQARLSDHAPAAAVNIVRFPVRKA